MNRDIDTGHFWVFEGVGGVLVTVVEAEIVGLIEGLTQEGVEGLYHYFTEGVRSAIMVIMGMLVGRKLEPLNILGTNS